MSGWKMNQSTYKGDLYVILLDKPESESQSGPSGRGTLGGRGTVGRHTKRCTNGSPECPDKQYRTRSESMAPATPKAEHEIADQLDKWIESIGTLGNMRSEYKLQDPFKVIALEQIMTVG